MKRSLLLWISLVLVIFLTVGYFQNTDPGSAAVRSWAWTLLRNRFPDSFHRDLRQTLGVSRLQVAQWRDVWTVLDEAHRTGSFADMTSAEAVRGILLLEFGYTQRGLEAIRRALSSTRVDQERFALLWAKGNAERRLGEYPGLASTVAELKRLDLEEEDLMPFSQALSRKGARSLTGRLGMAAGWFGLILGPILLVTLRSRRFLASRELAENRIMAYFAFRRSPVNLIVCLFSGIAIAALKLPEKVGLEANVTLAIVSFLIMYYSVLFNNHKLDEIIRKTEWSFGQFLATAVRFNILQLFVGIVFLISFFLVRAMVLALPMWGMKNPLGFALAFPAVSGLVILLFPWILPLLLGVRRLPLEEIPTWAREDESPALYRWSLPGSRFYNGLAFGYLTVQHGIILTSPLVDEFAGDEARAIFSHEVGHLRLGHLFRIFLLLQTGFLVLGLAVLLLPLEAQKIMVKGPTLPALIILAGWFLGLSSLLHRLLWECELEADAWAADFVGRELYIAALRKLHEENFLPVQWRESDNSRISHPPLNMRIRRLRDAAGTYVPPAGQPEATVLVSMWRSRLALDWKAGEPAALEIFALDDDVAGLTGAERWGKLAERHARFGAEVLLPREGNVVEILHCRQKTCAREAEPVLPVDRVCQLCRGGTFQALRITGGWRGTREGCVFSFPEAGPEVAPAS